MRFLSGAILALAVIATVLDSSVAKKPSSSRRPSSRRSAPPAAASRSSRSSGRAPVSRRRAYEEEDDAEDDSSMGFSEEVEEEEMDNDVYDEEEEEEDDFLPSVPAKAARKAAKRRPPPRKRPPPRQYDDEEDEYDRPRRSPRGPPRRGPPPKRGGRPPKGGSVVRYSREKPGGAVSAFTRGLSAIRDSMPDPSTVKDAALSSIDAARKTTSSLSANLYREVKGLTSSELEQVMLKATKPDDTPVKGKHVERLVGVTYQISPRYDIYDAVLRKLWKKMAESDWRTTMKALYILHRFSSDGAPEHAPALKARLRELRRTRDPKRKDKFFNSKQLLAGDARPENIKFRAFMSRYAHYVLLRAQCFGGMFDEIATLPKPDKKKAPKPITATCLRVEHLDAAMLLLKAGVVCQLKDGEECENTAIAAERVAADMIGLTTAVATALNRCLKDPSLKGGDPVLIQRWCTFYSQELLPQSKSMVKKLSPKLDAYGLFLPSRMGASVPQELLEKGLHLDGEAAAADSDEASPVATEESSKPKKEEPEQSEEEEKKPAAKEPEEALEEDAVYDDEYEYDEEEYYDDEEE